MVVVDLLLAALLVAGVLWVAGSDSFSTLWPSSFFYPLIGATCLTGLLMILWPRCSKRLLAARLAIVAIQGVFVFACLAVVGRAAVSTCQAYANPERQDLVSVSADTVSLDGQVTCQWRRSYGDPVGETRTYPVLRTLVGRLG